jgi:hypothetical protein
MTAREPVRYTAGHAACTGPRGGAMAENPRDSDPKTRDENKAKPGKNAPEMEKKEPEPEIKDAEQEDRFEATDN